MLHCLHAILKGVRLCFVHVVYIYLYVYRALMAFISCLLHPLHCLNAILKGMGLILYWWIWLNNLPFIFNVSILYNIFPCCRGIRIVEYCGIIIFSFACRYTVVPWYTCFLRYKQQCRQFFALSWETGFHLLHVISSIM